MGTRRSDQRQMQARRSRHRLDQVLGAVERDSRAEEQDLDRLRGPRGMVRRRHHRSLRIGDRHPVETVQGQSHQIRHVRNVFGRVPQGDTGLRDHAPVQPAQDTRDQRSPAEHAAVEHRRVVAGQEQVRDDRAREAPLHDSCDEVSRVGDQHRIGTGLRNGRSKLLGEPSTPAPKAKRECWPTVRLPKPSALRG